MFTFTCPSCDKEYPLYFQSPTSWCYACHTFTIMPDQGLGDEETAELCHTCNGSGIWIGGTIVNGYPTMSRKCNCCAGKGYQTPADQKRDRAYHEGADLKAIMGDLRYNEEDEKEVKVMNNNQYGVPVSEKGIACAACSYWEDGKKVVIHHATVAQIKLCSHRHNEAKAAASAQ